MSNSMTQSEFFRRLGARLSNPRWSWGGVRSKDGAVVLRVWQDRKKEHDGGCYMMVTHHSKYENNTGSLGYKERNKHLACIRDGAPCYMVMCTAVDVSAEPRKILRFDEKEIFVGGTLIDCDGESWIELVDCRAAASLFEE